MPPSDDRLRRVPYFNITPTPIHAGRRCARLIATHVVCTPDWYAECTLDSYAATVCTFDWYAAKHFRQNHTTQCQKQNSPRGAGN